MHTSIYQHFILNICIFTIHLIFSNMQVTTIVFLHTSLIHITKVTKIITSSHPNQINLYFFMQLIPIITPTHINYRSYLYTLPSYHICHFPSLRISPPDDPKSRQFTESAQNTHCPYVPPGGSSCIVKRCIQNLGSCPDFYTFAYPNHAIPLIFFIDC